MILVLTSLPLSFALLQVFEKERDVLVAELRTSQLVNGHESPQAGQLRDQIHTQVSSAGT